MLGTALTRLRTMATYLKSRFNAMILNPLLHWRIIGALYISQAIQSVISSLRASTKQNKDQLLALSQTLLASIIKVVTTTVILALGVLGILYQIIVHLYQQLAMRTWRKDQ